MCLHLLQHRAQLDSLDQQDRDVVSVAVSAGHVSVVRALMEIHAEVSTEARRLALFGSTHYPQVVSALEDSAASARKTVTVEL